MTNVRPGDFEGNTFEKWSTSTETEKVYKNVAVDSRILWSQERKVLDEIHFPRSLSSGSLCVFNAWTIVKQFVGCGSSLKARFMLKHQCDIMNRFHLEEGQMKTSCWFLSGNSDASLDLYLLSSGNLLVQGELPRFHLGEFFFFFL